MKILFLSDNFYPETNAAASRVYERAQYWVREGHEVTVITGCPNFPEGKPYPGYQNHWRKTETLAGIRVVRVKTYMAPNQGVAKRLLDFLSFMISATFFALFEKRPDVVMASSPQFFTAVAGYLVSLFKRVPNGLEIADLWPESVRAVGAMNASLFLNLMEKLELFLYRQASFVVALTPSIRQNMIGRGIDPDKVKTIINGVNLEFFGPVTCKDPELLAEHGLQKKFVVAYIGTIGMAHDLDNILGAAKILQAKGDRYIHFLIVGGGADFRRLLERKRLGNLDNVTIVGRQPKDEIARYWSLADLALVHLKNSETFKTVIPSKIFEAMALGKPILYCGPESDGSRIVLQEKVGERIDSGAPDALAATLLSIVQDPSRLSQYQRNTLLAAPHYSRAQQARLMLDAIANQLSAGTEEMRPTPPLQNR